MTSYKEVFKERGSLSEALYLAAFACYISFFYLQSTTFTMDVPGLIYSLVRAVIAGCAIYRLILWRSDINAFAAVALSVMTGLGIFFLISRGDIMVLDAALIMAGAYKVSFKRIGMMYVFVGVTVSLLALICSRTGVIPDYTFMTNYGENERVRHSLGIIYPTDCFAHVFYLAIAYFLLRWKRVTYREIAAFAVIFVVLYHFTSARVDFACAVLMLMIILICRITGFKDVVPDGLKKIFAVVLMPLCAAGIVILTYLYSVNRGIMLRLDAILSYRLSLGKTGMDLYGFKLLGSASFAENGNANGGVRDYQYVFYDSAYIKYLFKYGIILLLVLFVIYALIGLRLKSSRMYYAMVFISVITISFVIEHHMLELSYNITLLLLTADISTILQMPPHININNKNDIMAKTT